MKVVNKIKAYFKDYVDSRLVPACYSVAVAGGYSGTLQEFARGVLDAMESGELPSVSSCESEVIA